MKRRFLFFLPLATLLGPGPAEAVTAMFDFNTAGSVTQAGWTAAPLGTGTDGIVSIATSAIGAVTVDSRDRGLINTDTGDTANNDMWRDFAFANGSFSAAPGTGLRINITGLTANAVYPVTIWGFDESSNQSAGSPGRSADWSGGGAGPATLTFPSSPDPASLGDYMVTLNVTTDGGGAVELQGIVSATTPDASHNVFVNGLRIGDAIPEPSVAILAVAGLGLAFLRRRD